MATNLDKINEIKLPHHLSAVALHLECLFLWLGAYVPVTTPAPCIHHQVVVVGRNSRESLCTPRTSVVLTVPFLSLQNYFVQGFLFKQVQMRFYSGRPPYKELQEELRGDQSPWAPLSRESSITSAPSSHEGSLLRPRLALRDDSLPSSPPSRKVEAEELAVMANGTSGAVAGAASGGGGDGDCAPYVTHM